MPLFGDNRRRSVALLAGGALLFLSLLGSPDQREGMSAFIEKRKANFQKA